MLKWRSSFPARLQQTPLVSLALGLAVLLVCAAYGFLLSRDLPIALIMGAPVAAVVAVVGLRRPELLTVALLAITWGYVSEVLVKFQGAPSVAKSIVVLLVLVVLYQRVMTPGFRLATHPLLWWMLAYTLVVCAGLWYAEHPERTWLVVIDVTKELLLLFVVMNTLTTERWLARGVLAMLLVGAVLASLTLYQELTRSYGNSFGGFARSSIGQIADGVSNRARAGGPINEPNAFGQQMLVLVPIGLWAAFYARTILARVIGGYAAFACLAGAALSFSRGAYLALIVMVVLLAVRSRLNWRYLLLLPLLLFALNNSPPELRARFTTLYSLLPGGERQAGERDASLERREIQMQMAVYMFLDHPLVGVGADNYSALFRKYVTSYGSDVDVDTRNAHSYYLEIAAEHGVLGLLVIGGVMIVTLISLRRARLAFKAVGNERMAELATALRISFICYAVTAIFLHGDYTRFFWLQVDIAAACSLVAMRLAGSSLAPTAADPHPLPLTLTGRGEVAH